VRRGLWLVVVSTLAGCQARKAASSSQVAPEATSTATLVVLEAGAPDAVASSQDAGDAGPTDMLFVPGGTFTMGADQGGEADEHPAHAVTLAGFWLDRTPVTNEAYERCVAAGACAKAERRAASYHGAPANEAFFLPRHPVIGVSWDDAKAFCAWAGKRLPREAEYERAMRDDDGRTYAWGNEPPTPERAVFGRPLGAPDTSTDDVATHPRGRGPWGHDDLAGEVWEWCEDEYDPYAYRRKTADRGVPGTCDEILAAQDELRARAEQGFTGSNPIPRECEHVLRGGGFNYGASGLRATNRVHHPGSFHIVMAGFRCARSP
jgi:formylglycine-generating enzyme required for sulfatase activity